MNQTIMRDSGIVKARIAKGLPAIITKRGEMMATLGANQLMDGTYDALTEEFTKGQTEVLKNTPYQYYDDFQVSRDQRIADNIKALAISNRGKRIIVLTGANHHNRAVNELKKVRSVNLITQVQDH
jgi:erythromycin esterase-like protein